MKRVRSIFKKRLSLVLVVIMLIGFLPLITAEAAEAAPIASIAAVKDSTGVSATLNNFTPTGINASLIFAVYEPSGKLSYIKEYPVTAGAGSSATQRFNYDVATHPDNIIKLFAWDRLTFIPLCSEISSSLCITVDGSGAAYNGISVTAASDVKEFTYVRIDQLTKRGKAFTATKTGNTWTHAKAEGVDVVIAFRPLQNIGGALPDVAMTELSMINGVNKIRVVVTL